MHGAADGGEPHWDRAGGVGSGDGPGRCTLPGGTAGRKWRGRRGREQGGCTGDPTLGAESWTRPENYEGLEQRRYSSVAAWIPSQSGVRHRCILLHRSLRFKRAEKPFSRNIVIVTGEVAGRLLPRRNHLKKKGTMPMGVVGKETWVEIRLPATDGEKFRDADGCAPALFLPACPHGAGSPGWVPGIRKMLVRFTSPHNSPTTVGVSGAGGRSWPRSLG